MKKKIVSGVIVLIFVIVIVIAKENKPLEGLEDKNKGNNSEQIVENDLIYTSKILTQDGEYIAMISKEGKQFRYQIEEITYVFSDEISIKIPQLKQVDGNSVSFANSLIQNVIVNELEMYSQTGKLALERYTYDIVLEGNQIISIVFTGNINTENAAYPSEFIIVANIDLLTGKLLDTTNIIENEDEFIKLLKSDKAVYEGVEGAEKYIKKDLDENILKAEIFETSKKMYFTSEYICTVISVPHAIGDYAVIKLKYDDLK